MKKLLLSFILGLLYFSCFTQLPTLNWVRQTGTLYNEAAAHLITDANGNLYHTGTFTGTMDFNPDTGTYNLTATSLSYFISKWDSLGNFLWARQIGGAMTYERMRVAIDAKGNVYLTDLFTGTVDFDPGPGVYNLTPAITITNSDIFVMKLDSSGNFIWAKQAGGAWGDTPRDIVLDPSGYIYLTGYFQGVGDFDPGSGTYNLSNLSTSYGDIFILKLDTAGKFVWAKSIGGNNNDIGTQIKQDGSLNLYIAGHFSNSVDFNPGPGIQMLTSKGLEDIFILKLDSSGNFIWVKQIGSAALESINDMRLDNSGNLFAIGDFIGVVDFNPSSAVFNLTSNGMNDMFLIKLNATGNFVWAKSIGGINQDYSVDLFLNVKADIHIIGSFRDSVDFDPGIGKNSLKAVGPSAMFIEKLDSSGSFFWVKKLDGINSYVSGYGICMDRSENIYCLGNFTSTLDFNPGLDTFNLTSKGSEDLFILKLGSCKLDKSIVKTGTILTSNSKGTRYQWVNCPSYSIISGATAKSYTATNNGSYALIVKTSDCVDTSSCVTITSLGVGDYYSNQSFKIYPNPTSGMIKVALFNPSEIDKIEIYNVYGKLIYNLAPTSLENIIDLYDTANGLYIINMIKNGEIISSSKLIKQ